MTVLGLLSMARSQTLVTNVTAVPLWTDTGISLTNGEWVNINAAGFWYWNTGFITDPDGSIDPSDNSDAWVQNDEHGSLVAFIGSNPYTGSPWTSSGTYQTNRYLEIGTARQFMNNTNGELWLGINDDFDGAGTNDNGLSVVAAISLGLVCGNNYSNITLSVASVSSNSFSFYISNGIPSTICAIYDSSDLTHWTLVDSIILDTNGSSSNAIDNDPPAPTVGIIPGTTGLINGAFVNAMAVPYRFYKVSNGPFWSQPIGFERMTVGPGTLNSEGTNSLIADQLIAPANTLNGLFSPMVDGSTLPNGTVVEKWNGGGYLYYTNLSGSWLPNGSVTLLPGETAFVVIPTNASPTTITFAGLVPEGMLTNYTIFHGLNNYLSSMVPQAGGLHCPLGYNPSDNDAIGQWVGYGKSSTGYYAYDYAGQGVGSSLGYQSDWEDGSAAPPMPPSIPGDQTDASDSVYWAPAPVFQVGQGFFIQNFGTTNEYWIRKFPGCEPQ